MMLLDAIELVPSIIKFPLPTLIWILLKSEVPNSSTLLATLELSHELPVTVDLVALLIRMSTFELPYRLLFVITQLSPNVVIPYVPERTILLETINLEEPAEIVKYYWICCSTTCKWTTRYWSSILIGYG